MKTYVLTDVSKDVWVDHLEVNASKLGVTAPRPFSVSKKTLRGGRRDGVDIIQVSGDLAFSVIPTRGMGIGTASYLGERVGWFSPVVDGPVHPAHVPLSARGGLGWLEGFDELLVRCGLENNGAPYQQKTEHPDGSESYTIFPLHGRIANIPAHYVAVSVDDVAPHRIVIEGRVAESKLFGTQLELRTKITTTPGTNRIHVRDEVVNLGDSPQEAELIYHWNFGPPYLDEGARFVAPIKEVMPRDARAREGIGHYDVYGRPEPGFAEQVYFATLHGAGSDGKTCALLRNRGGTKGVMLRFATAQLPYFTLWKSTRGLKEGYVTGLEPGINFPNPKPFEKKRGRVVEVPPGGSFVAEVVLEVFNTAMEVTAAEEEIRKLQAASAPNIRQDPDEPFAPKA